LPPYFPNIPSQQSAWTDHYNANRGADANVETILKQLEADGELENTIIFFFSDHGSPVSLRHKQFCYEGGMLVPLMIKGNHPVLKSGVVRSDLVSLLDISATTLSMGKAKMPKYLDGQDLFAASFNEQDYIIGARDRCDYTIDKIRTVVSEDYRYIRNYYPNRPMMQAGYRDKKAIVKDMKKAYKEGKLTPYQAEHWFGVRPTEELYDLKTDPHQINNLAENSEFSKVLVEHRNVLENWIKETDDKGQYPEDARQLKATYDLWKDRPRFKNAKVNPEYDQFKE
jgi:arylsulfatase A-like enzyme